MAKKIENNSKKGYVYHLVCYDGNGDRKQVRRRNNNWTKAEAEAAERAEIEKLKKKGYVFKKSTINNDTYKPVTITINGKNVLKSEVTTEMLVDSFLNSRRTFLRPSTVAHMKYTFENHLFGFFGKDRKIEDISPSELEEFKLYLVNKNASDNTNSKRITELRQIFIYARKNLGLDCVLINDDFVIRSDNCNTREYRIITIAEYNRFIDTFNEINDGSNALKYRVFFKLLYTCSARKGEIDALTWDKINFEKRTVRINVTYAPVVGKPQNINATKTKNDLTKPILDSVYDDVVELYNLAKSHDDFSENEFIFNKFAPIPYTTITRVFKAHLAMAGLDDMRIHDFRHSSATALYNNTNDIVSTAHYIGHSSVRMCMTTYVHSSDDDKRKVGNTLDYMIQNNQEKYTRSILEDVKDIICNKLSPSDLEELQTLISDVIKRKIELLV